MHLPSGDDEAKLLGRALATLRDRAGLTQAEAAERLQLPRAEGVGVTSQAWGAYESGKRAGIFRPDIQARLAAAVDATREDLMVERASLEGSPGAVTPSTEEDPTFGDRAGRAEAAELVMLPVRDKASAGAWRMADEMGQVSRRYPAARDPRYPHADQWLTEVDGDSVNRLGIFSGDLAHMVSAIDIGYFPRTDDIVEVERLRFGGAMRELTIKQVVVTPQGVELWPRSTNDIWRDPIRLNDGAEGEEFEVRIRGLLVANIRRY